jgi:hypothetical protein
VQAVQQISQPLRGEPRNGEGTRCQARQLVGELLEDGGELGGCEVAAAEAGEQVGQ